MATPVEDEDLELRHYIDVLRRRKFAVIATVVPALVAGTVLTLLQAPVYRAKAEILVQPPLSERIFAPTGDTARGEAAAGSDVATQVAVLESTSVREGAEAALGRKIDVDIKRKGDTDVVEVVARADTKAEAQRAAQVYTDTYLTKRREQLAAELTSTIDAVKAEIAALDGLIGDLDRKIQDLNTVIQATSARDVRAPLEAQRDQLTQQRAAPDARRADLQQRLDRLQLASTVTKTGGVELLSAASVAPGPGRSALVRNLAVALALGLVLGVVIAFLRDHFDDTLRSESDLERAGGDSPVIGAVPIVGDWRDRTATHVVMRSAPDSPAAEAYSRLRISLDVAGTAKTGAILQVTSAGPGDGKTTTVANLGISFAKAGRRVVLVDANLRRPRLHRFFSLDNDAGLTSVLLGKAPLSPAIRTLPDVARLKVLPSGPRPSSPSELLSGERLKELIESLAAQSDIVLVDSPPLPVSDAIVLSGRVQAVIVVVCADRTRGRDLAEAREALGRARAPFAGIVLNCSSDKAGHGLTYGREAPGERQGAPGDEAAVEPRTPTPPKPEPVEPAGGRATRVQPAEPVERVDS